MFVSSSPMAAVAPASVPGPGGRVQGSRAPEGRAKSRPQKQRQKHQQPPPLSSALVVPVGSSDSEGQFHRSMSPLIIRQHWTLILELQFLMR